MKKLIVLRGNSGSGKTTVAKELQKRFGQNTMLISQDVIRRDILNTKDGKNTLTLPLLKQLLEYGYSNCKYVILEGILRSDWYSDLFDLAIGLYGNNIFAYYYDIPFEITIERYKTKSADIQDRFNENDMRRWWVEKDYAEALSEQAITKEQTFDNIVSEIYSKVSEE